MAKTTRQPPSGAAALIIANGPSVDAVPADLWPRLRSRRGLLLIGTNRALAFAALQTVPLDAMVIRDTYRSLWHDQRWGCLYHERLWKPFAGWKVGPADRRVTHCDQFLRFAERWQARPRLDENGEAAVVAASTVCLMAANWAFLRGCRRIYFLGLDYRGQHPRMVEPFDQAAVGWQGQYDQPPPPRIEDQFAAAADAVARLGGRLRNLSPGSRLKAVPSATWNQVLGEPHENRNRLRQSPLSRRR